MSMLASVALIATACSAGIVPPAGALGVSEREWPGVLRVTGTIEGTFPDSPALVHYAQEFAKRGWSRCPNVPQEWGAVATRERGEEVTVEVLAAAWVSADRQSFAELRTRVDRPTSKPVRPGERTEQTFYLDVGQAAALAAVTAGGLQRMCVAELDRKATSH